MNLRCQANVFGVNGGGGILETLRVCFKHVISPHCEGTTFLLWQCSAHE